MRQLNSRGQANRSGYVFKFAGTAALLVLGTLVLVLYVLPERYVLSSGFREGNLNLPNPRIPFEPAPPLRVAAIPDIPRGPRTVSGPPAQPSESVPARGPAERFWARVLPLLEARRYREAIPLFADYLNRFPGDLGVRREYAITLAAAGYGDEAVPILQELLEYEDDDALHLLLARTLRDQRRVTEAAPHYRIVFERNPGDAELALEWARALSWIGDYDGAMDVLREAMAQTEDDASLRAEMVRVLVYAGELEAARDLLDSMTEEEIQAQDLAALRDDIRGWLTPAADTVAAAPPSLLEQARRAREADELERADSLFQAAVAEDPDDEEAWVAYADFLQYEREDFLGALDALREAQRARVAAEGAPDPALEYRMAQLEIWTEQTDAARSRLEALLARMDREGVGGEPPATGPDATDTPSAAPRRADVLALLGDLSRWNGERLPAVRRYQAALEADPEHVQAAEGLEAIRAEVDRFLVQSEEPGIGGVASGFADTDDFRRYQAGGAWTGMHDQWVWSTTSGARWLEGIEPGAGLATREGLFAELEGARWWRWGTVRTALHLDVQNVRSNSVDVGFGASARFLGGSGGRTDVRADHAPAFAATNTLQSVVTRVWQSRLSLAHSRPLSERWTGAVTGEIAVLDHRDIAGSDANRRLQAAVSAGRPLSSVFTAGLAARALTYTDPAPTVGTSLPQAPSLRLYWDPELSLSVGPYLQMNQPVSTWWSLTGRLNPGVAYIQERDLGSEIVPDLSARLGVLRDGARYRTRVEIFYGQGRFSAYRSYGVDVSFSARGFLGPGFSGS